MIITNDTQKETLLEAGRRLRKVLDAVAENIVEGVSATELDKQAYTMIIEGGDKPAFLNYKPMGMKMAFPATLCVSLNHEMVHGIPKDTTILKDGDIVSIDCGLEHNGVFVDAACTRIVGKGDEKAKALVEATRKALQFAIVSATAGNTTGDIGSAVETVSKEHGFTIPPELGGHGLGNAQHEEPFIPNIGDPGEGSVLRDGEVIALEPIFSEGDDPRIAVGPDGFTYCTKDNARSAHFEHTILVTKEAPIVVTGPLW